MTDVAAAFAEAGCAEVRTFIASGNILFDGPARVSRALDSRIKRAMASCLGAEPVIIYRTMAELQAIVAGQPFGGRTGDPRLKLYVIFLAAPPQTPPRFPLSLPKEALEAIAMTATGDVLVVSGRKPSGMYGFPNNWIEAELGVPATSRNWSTVTRLAALLH